MNFRVKLGRIEEMVLRRCANQVVNFEATPLEYKQALDKLVALGLAYRDMEDDQPTAYATAAGEVLVKELGKVAA